MRADAGLILAAVLDLTKISVGAADIAGRLLIEHHEGADLSAGPVQTAKRLATLFDWILDQHGERRQVWGIAIAAPGPMEAAVGQRFGPSALDFTPNWKEYPLTEHLALRHAAPVAVRNSVQMHTLGELRAEAGRAPTTSFSSTSAARYLPASCRKAACTAARRVPPA